MLEELIEVPNGFTLARRLRREDVEPCLPDPIHGAVDQFFLYKNEQDESLVVVYRTQLAGTPHLHQVRPPKK